MERQGAVHEENADRLSRMDVSTVQPKGILIIGHTSQLNDRKKRNSFELFRQGLINPEIITFDELLERAKHLLLNDRKHTEVPSDTADDEDDIPF